MNDSDKWYWQDEDQKVIGPFNRDALRRLVSTGVINDDTMVAKAGDEEWLPLARAGILNGEGLEDNYADPSIIKIECPGCSQSLSATSDLQGMTFQCPSCNGLIVVPTADVNPPHAASNIPAPVSYSKNQGNGGVLYLSRRCVTQKKLFILVVCTMLACLSVVLFKRSSRPRETQSELSAETHGVYFTYPIIGESVDDALARKNLSRAEVKPKKNGFSTVLYLGPRGKNGITWDGMLVYIFNERVVGFWYLPGNEATHLENPQHANAVMEDVMKVYRGLEKIGSSAKSVGGFGFWKVA